MAEALPFYGVFSPRGELEAVEGSKDLADLAAVNLSPDQRQPTRVVEPLVEAMTFEARAGILDREAEERHAVGQALLDAKAKK